MISFSCLVAKLDSLNIVLHSLWFSFQKKEHCPSLCHIWDASIISICKLNMVDLYVWLALVDVKPSEHVLCQNIGGCRVKILEDGCICKRRSELLIVKHHLIRLTYILKMRNSCGHLCFFHKESSVMFLDLSCILVNSCYDSIDNNTDYWWIFGANLVKAVMFYVLLFSVSFWLFGVVADWDSI